MSSPQLSGSVARWHPSPLGMDPERGGGGSGRLIPTAANSTPPPSFRRRSVSRAVSSNGPGAVGGCLSPAPGAGQHERGLKGSLQGVQGQVLKVAESLSSSDRQAREDTLEGRPSAVTSTCIGSPMVARSPSGRHGSHPHHHPHPPHHYHRQHSASGPSELGGDMAVAFGAPGMERLSVLSGRHVLVVDDNLINRKVAGKLLERYGARVTAVDSGRRAVDELAPGHSYDLVFMDLQMPQMDGLEATQRIREREQVTRTPRVRIVALTADVISGTREKCFEVGMDDYLSKPIEEDQLARIVSDCFNAL
eukprot:TRINITY_DN5630_c0_g2_i6.p1 TRINITY_DN5630_c0_g2~~TRINITY_DN5630_c0_g2_i6.p1  ORF type:complete len:315 (-),score=9.80 TRINITY_DN5630_c0_g2_i6:48-968(-)